MYHEGELVQFLSEVQGTALDSSCGSINAIISSGAIGVILGWDIFGYEILVGDSVVYHVDCDGLTVLDPGV